MGFLRDCTALQFKERVDGLLATLDDRTQFPPPPVPRAQDLAQRHRIAGEIGGDSLTEKFFLMEDADLTHVPRIEADRHLFPDVRNHDCRQIAETFKVDTILPDLACSNFLHQQQIELLQGIRHPR
jgi:hypothetical protein